jgi:hypothetical protein
MNTLFLEPHCALEGDLAAFFNQGLGRSFAWETYLDGRNRLPLFNDCCPE